MTTFNRKQIAAPVDATIAEEKVIGTGASGLEYVVSTIATGRVRTKLFRFSDSGVLTVAAGITLSAFGTAGVVHNSSAGVFSSSLIVNADIAPGAAIGVAKLELGATNTVLHSNGTVNAFTGAPILSTSLQVRADATRTVIRELVGSATTGALYMGNVTPDASNFAFSSDGSNNTGINAPSASGRITFAHANSLTAQISPAASVNVGFRFAAGFATPLFGQVTQTADVNGIDLTVQPQAPLVGSTNRSPGHFIINIPDPTGSGAYSTAQIAFGGQRRAAFWSFPGSTQAYLYLGTSAMVAPGGPGIGNYSLSGGQITTALNVGDPAGVVTFTIANASQWSVFSGKLSPVSGQAALIEHLQRTGDNPTFDFTWRSQQASATASPGVNRNSGSLIADIAAPGSGGTAGSFKVTHAAASAFEVNSTSRYKLFGIYAWTRATGAGGTEANGSLHIDDTAGVEDILFRQNGAWVSLISGGTGGFVPSSRQIIAGAGLTQTPGPTLAADMTINAVANADGSIVVNANDIQVGVISDAQHGNRGGGALHTAVTNLAAGFAPAITAANRVLLSTSGTAAVWGQVDLATMASAGAANTVLWSNGSANSFTGSPILSTSLTVGINPSTVGAIRLTNATGVFGRNAANSVNITLVTTDASDRVVIGSSATAVRISTLGPGVIHSDDAFGTLSSSSIVGADITNSTITTNKLNAGGVANRVLVTTNGASVTWGQIDLTSMVSGLLPNANQAAQTLAGDVTGTTAASVVEKLTGVGGVVTHAGSTITTAQTELVLENTGDTLGACRIHVHNRANEAGLVVSNSGVNVVDIRCIGSGGAFSNIRLEGRVGSKFIAGASAEWQIGAVGAPILVIGDGTSGCMFRASVVQWANGTAPFLTVASTTLGSGSFFSVQAQTAGVGTGGHGGPLVLAGGGADGAGVPGFVETRLANGNGLRVQSTPSDPTHWQWNFIGASIVTPGDAIIHYGYLVVVVDGVRRYLQLLKDE